MSANRNNKPWAESSEQNRLPILEVLKKEFLQPGTVLEIGSGTGQHAVYFSTDLPHLQWQPTDVLENLIGIEQWRNDSGLTNIHRSIALNVEDQWPELKTDYAFSANTAHIMSLPQVKMCVQGIATTLKPSGKFCLYGPFNRDGNYTSDSNRNFDGWLKSRDPLSGIRDIGELENYATTAGLALVREYKMPANNLILVFEKNIEPFA